MTISTSKTLREDNFRICHRTLKFAYLLTQRFYAKELFLKKTIGQAQKDGQRRTAAAVLLILVKFRNIFVLED